MRFKTAAAVVAAGAVVLFVVAAPRTIKVAAGLAARSRSRLLMVEGLLILFGPLS